VDFDTTAVFIDKLPIEDLESLPDDVIALATYPRAGNSMLRLLLEKTTRIHTGSIYNDRRLLDDGWVGEGTYAPDKVVFVKTHDPMFKRCTSGFSPYSGVAGGSSCVYVCVCLGVCALCPGSPGVISPLGRSCMS